MNEADFNELADAEKEHFYKCRAVNFTFFARLPETKGRHTVKRDG